ncbi:hypothetical protein GLOIN_2v1774297 [Rhizophagus clarus]|uniref:Uncharacterized protein n=1 Tax=Rhizophagus clarus TaxID=94130 RepID=A0A8H3LPE0_9GLOM|nr:hypothetical protein GLOIN_2v1774297 [Rhizophagus clarus]
MATFYEKNGCCIEKKNGVQQVDSEDIITWITYIKKEPPRKYSDISDEKWNEAIAKTDALLIVDKDKKNKCSSEKMIDTRNDICNIIGIFKNFSELYEEITKNKSVEGRVYVLAKDHYGMTADEVGSLFGYKIKRNCTILKKFLEKGKTKPILSQQLQNAFELLQLVTDQPSDFLIAFEKCAK